MATFMIPGDIITKVGTLGGGAPQTGYYSAKIESIQAHPTRATSRRVNIVFETGFSTMYWLNSPFDDKGNKLPGLSESQVMGMVRAVKTLFVSAGFTNEQMVNGVTDEWLVGKTLYLDWHSAQDRGSQYGEIEGTNKSAPFITEAVYKQYKASGKKPACAGAGDAASAAPAPAAAAVAAPATPTVITPTPMATVAPAPSNGGGIALPPPPGAAGLMS